MVELVKVVEGLLTTASNDGNVNQWYINFLSAVEFDWVSKWTAKDFAVGLWGVLGDARGVNVYIREYFRKLPIAKKRFGVIMMDYPNIPHPDLLTAIIQYNF